MELRHLRYFVALGEELHFGRAASRLSITQPPLSLSIRNLEDELRVQLFERDSRRVELTLAGRAFLARARDILAHAESSRQLARVVASGRAGRLQIGFAESLAWLDVLPRVRTFAAANADIELCVEEREPREQLDALRTGSIDAGFVTALTDIGGLEHRIVATDVLALCVPSSFAMKRRERVELASLRDAAFVLHAAQDSGGPRSRAVDACARAGFVPRIGATAPQTLGVISLVAAGLGVALVPASFGRAGVAGARFMRLAGPDAKALACHLVWNARCGDPSLERFVNALCEPHSSYAGSALPVAPAAAGAGPFTNRRER